MRKFYSLLILFLAVQLLLQAQTKSITGKITDANGNPLPGATINAKGTAVGVSTKDDGTFSIAVPSSVRTLVVSYVGFANKEVDVRNATTITTSLSLAGNTDAMQEVVVVAYGTQQKKNMTGAVSVVNETAIKRQQVTTVTQALQGTASGVLVVNNTGQPGEVPQIRIRGVASVNASAEPLLVVDGIPYDGNLNMLNPSDIESFSVLKDATATSLYGSRAANGVILITTKTGKRDSKPVINLSATFGVSERALPEYPFLNTQQHFELGWEALRNLYRKTPATIPNPDQEATDKLVSEIKYNPYNIPKPVGTDGKLVAGATPLWNTDWTEELTRSRTLRNDINLGISGGSEKSKYFLSAGYLKQQGYIITSEFERINTRFNYTTDVKDWLQVGVKTAISFSNQNYPDQDGTDFENTIQYIRQMSSIYPVYQRGEKGEQLLDAAGEPIYDFGNPNSGRTVNVNRNTLQPSNLVATTLTNEESRKRFITSLNAYATIKLAKDLAFKSSFGIDRYNMNTLSYETPEFGNGQNVGGRAVRQSDIITSWTWNNMLTYSKRFGEHNLEVMASTEAYKYDKQTSTGQKTNFPFSGITEFNSAATTESLTGSTVNTTIASYLGRVKYDFRSKYFAEITLRWDGSSRFAPDYQWGFFPAAGVSWLMSEEDFLKNSNTISFLKLRASYGQVGNNNLTNYFPYLSSFSTGYDNLTYPGVYLTQLANEKIRWEKQGNLNIGVDFGFWSNRLTGSIDYFNKTSQDLLFSKPLVFSGGIPSVDFNIGTVQNSGVELSLNGRVIKGKKFDWTSSLNITYIENTLKKLPQEKILKGAYQYEVGRSIYEFYMQEWAGVDPANGAPLWYKDETDASGNPTGKKITVNKYDQATRYYVGSAIPKVSGGWTNTFNYGNIDFSFLINYAFGGKIYDGNYSNLMHGFTGNYGTQMSTDVLNRWQKAGDITNVPILDENNTDIIQRSTRFLFSGDYVRLRNITLGYTFNTDKWQKVVKSARVYLQADNVYTWSNLKKGADPETNIDGSARQTSTMFKTFSAGVAFNF
jgi:TonB-linked SusC/RagA family outer membrane protein